MVEAAENRVAVYIDFDNIVISRYDEVNGRDSFRNDKMRTAYASIPPADPARVDIGAIIDYATSYGNVVISRAFADWSAPANASYARQLVTRAVDLTQLFPTAAAQKNGADIRLSVDVVEDMFRLSDITHVVIVAGDSDFIPLAQRCRRLGRFVVGIGVAGSTSKPLAGACDEFEYYDKLPGVTPVDAKTQSRVASAKTKTRLPAVSDAIDAPVEETTDPDQSATDLLIRAVRIVQTKSDDEWAHSGGVKSLMQRLDGSFSEKSLGFKSFLDFVKSRKSDVEIATGNPPGRMKLRESASEPK